MITGTSYEVRVYPSAEGISVYWIDITERKRAEEEIMSLARFPAENPTPILRLDSSGIVLYANPVSARLLEACVCGDDPSVRTARFSPRKRLPLSPMNIEAGWKL